MGDWCWNMKPFKVTDETKSMVMDNITFMLNNFMKCSEFDYIIFCWVIHHESIFEEIITKLDMNEYELYKVTLICNEEALIQRLKIDVKNGVRNIDIIDKSVDRIELYNDMNTKKVDVSQISAHEAALKVIDIIGQSGFTNAGEAFFMEKH